MPSAEDHRNGEIRSAHLSLIVIPIEVLELVAAEAVGAAADDRAAADIPWSDVATIPGELVPSLPARMRLDQLADDPSLAAWLVRAIVIDDPDAPSGLEIARIIARQLDYEWDEVLIDGDDGELGQYPWNARYPVILDTSAVLALGYQPAGSYAETVAPAIDWLVAAARGEIDGRTPNLDDPYLAPLFNYAAEDAYLASR